MMSSEGLVGRLSALIDAAAAVVGELDLDEVLRRLVSEARSATGARYAALGVLGPHGVLTEFIHEGLEEGAVERIGSLPQGRGVLGTVVREKKTIVVDDISTHPDYYGFPEGHPPMTTFLGVPIRAGQSTFGNLYLTDKQGGFDDTDVTLVEALAVIAGAAVNTARLRTRLSEIAIVEDRERIARDLHDSIIQDLFAIGLSLQGVADRSPDELFSRILHEAVDRLDQAVEMLRRYIYELKTSDDLRRPLASQLEDLVERLGHAYPTTLTLNVTSEVDHLEGREAEEVVKVVTEAVSNALRHASADHVRIKLEADGESVTLTVQDDGVGFDVETTQHGLGLANMRKRVRRLGGHVDIQSTRGAGTTVSISLPAL